MNNSHQATLINVCRFISYLHKAGFHKEMEFAFPHKQAALMKISRDAWDAPAL